jgi:hypothetical protein
MLLGVAKGDLDAPPHRVPGDNLLGFVPRGLNRLSPPTSADRLARHDAQRLVRRREDSSFSAHRHAPKRVPSTLRAPPCQHQRARKSGSTSVSKSSTRSGAS